jgi:hypothetical protein
MCCYITNIYYNIHICIVIYIRNIYYNIHICIVIYLRNIYYNIKKYCNIYYKFFKKHEIPDSSFPPHELSGVEI